MKIIDNYQRAAQAMHSVALFLIAVLAVSVLSYTIFCLIGIAPWLSMQATFGSVTFTNAGEILQIGLTVLIGALLFFIPTNTRILALESSHRNFNIRMEDVARAYHICHTADRAGVFTLSAEFDQVRERLAYLRDHPDLEQLEPGVMEVAAQMSQQARHLSDVYSTEKVSRAKDFLRQRQEEAELQQERIVEALHHCQEIQKWADQVEVEESIVASQLSQLDEKLRQALPLLGYAMDHSEPVAQQDNIVPMPKKPAAE